MTNETAIETSLLKNKKIDYVNRAISKFALVDYVAWVDVDYINSMEVNNPIHYNIPFREYRIHAQHHHPGLP